MIVFGRELLCEVVQEVGPLLQAHHAEMGSNMPLDPDWQQYTLLEQMGRFLIFTGRDDDKLVAYNAFHLIRHLQSRQFTQAMNDVFYVAPEVRRGITAMRFLNYCDGQLTAEGARQIVYFASPHNNLAPLLHRIGYADRQVMVAKTI